MLKNKVRNKYINKKFNNLLVISYSHAVRSKSKKMKNYYNVLCDCGVTKIISSDSLMSGVKSCGCSKVENSKIQAKNNRKGEGVASFNRVLSVYKMNAKSKNRSFTLTTEEFKFLISQNCHYCGDEPTAYKNKHFDNFKYNGIDRVNNEEGYDINNCVTCCTVCNKMKLAFSEDVFKDKIIKIYNNFIKNGK